MTPLLATWALGAMWFTTGHHEQKAQHLSAYRHCALTTGTDTLTGMDYVIEGTATLVTDQDTRVAAATAFEQAYGWRLIREDGTWYGLGDAVRIGTAQLYRIRPDKGFAFFTGNESSQTRYQWTRRQYSLALDAPPGAPRARRPRRSGPPRSGRVVRW